VNRFEPGSGECIAASLPATSTVPEPLKVTPRLNCTAALAAARAQGIVTLLVTEEKKTREFVRIT
jgi:hypothetical protein